MRSTLFLLILIPMMSSAQMDVRSAKDMNRDGILDGIISLKVKSEFREACDRNMVRIPALAVLLDKLGCTGLRKKFPDVSPPIRRYNDKGLAMADISLIYEIRVPASTDLAKAAESLSRSEAVEYAEPCQVSYPMYTPNDAGIASVQPYHFDNTEAYAAWDVTLGDTNVVIGITETSIDVGHEDLSGNIKYNYADPIGNGDEDSDSYVDNFAGWDMVDNDNDLFINNDIHGTAVAAVASATADNGIGYAGLGFKCKFLPVKVGNSSQVITQGYEGIQYCVAHGCSVINCSWGNTTFSQTAQDIITWAVVNNDAVIVAAAGNVTGTDYYYPASYNYVLSVTGVDANDLYDNGSNPPFTRNDSVDVSAPGFDVYTTATYNGSYLYSPPQGGTSMAAPIVAGIAGLVRSQFPCLTALEVIEKIKASSDPIDNLSANVPYAGLLGTGRVNALSAVSGNPCGPVGMPDRDEMAEMTVYPNPGTDVIGISYDGSSGWRLQVSDISGKLLIEKRMHGSRADVSGLKAGIYVATVTDGRARLHQRFTVLR